LLRHQRYGSLCRLRPHEEERTGEFLDSLGYYPLTREIAREAGLLKRHWSRKGTTLSLADATIARWLGQHLPLITATRSTTGFPSCASFHCLLSAVETPRFSVAKRARTGRGDNHAPLGGVTL